MAKCRIYSQFQGKTVKPKGKAKAIKVKKLGAKDVATLEEAKKSLPPHPGIQLHQESVWHTRYKLLYPVEGEVDETTSMCYNEDSPKTQRAAIVHCLRFAWNLYTRANKVECPYDLDIE